MKISKANYGYGICLDGAMWTIYTIPGGDLVAYYDTFEHAKDFVEKAMHILITFNYNPN